jgi:hypothetical protein
MIHEGLKPLVQEMQKAAAEKVEPSNAEEE